jgi:uncharacterized coiled-coil protein SlyX
VRHAAALVALALASCALVEPPSTTPAPVEEAAAPAPVEEPAAPALVVEPPAPAPTPPAPAVEAEDARQVAELLGYTQRVAGLGLEDQKRELATATQAFNRERSNANRVRLGLLYSTPGAAIQDDARAAQLLEPIASGGGALRQLAGLVHAQVTDRLKVQKRADQLKDQVEQLREIEKQLLERGSQAPPPPRKP